MSEETKSNGQIIVMSDGMASEDSDDIFSEEDNELEEINIGGKNLGIGVKVPTSIKIPLSYIDSLREYDDMYNNIYSQMKVCWKLYKFNPIVGSAVDVLVDFAVTSLRAEDTGDEKLNNLLEWFFVNLNKDNSNTVPGVYPLMQELALEWFTSGNSFPYVKWEEIEVGKLDGSWKMPVSINLINPQSIEIPTEPIAFGQEVIYLRPDATLLSKLQTDGRSDPEAALLKKAIPRGFMEAIKKRNYNWNSGIRLNPKFISHLKRKVKGYHAWGIPYLARCLGSSALLERLRQVDESISSGLLNLITIFRVGTEEHPANKQRLTAFANLIRNPKATTTLVWAHDVDVLQVGPDGKVLQYKDKYKQAKEDLIIGLGLPPVLISLNQQGDAWVSILSLIERLSNWRQITSIWLEKICKQIAENNGFSNKRIKIKWDRMNLKEESSIKNLILAFYDRGLISIGTALNESGYNLEGEISKKEKEKEISDLFFPPNLPFSGNNQETDKNRPSDEDPKMTKNNIKKSQDKPVKTVNLKEEKKKRPVEPKKPEG